MSETLVVSCPKCGNPVRIPGAEENGRCEACNAVVSRNRVLAGAAGPGELPLSRSVIFVGSLVLFVAGAAAFRSFRRASQGALGSGETQPTPIYSAPAPVDSQPAPPGEIAWISEARAPVVLAVNDDDVEDLFGFYRIWDGRSAWMTVGGAFDGKTLTPMWRTEAIDPQLLKSEDVVPHAVVVGSRLVVSDTSPTLRIVDIRSGQNLLTLHVADGVVDLCKRPEAGGRAAAPTIWVKVLGDQNALVDIESGKATASPRPSWCGSDSVTPGKEGPKVKPAIATGPCRADFRNSLATATCLSGDQAPPLGDGVHAQYLLKEEGEGSGAVALATKDGLPYAAGIGAGYKPTWQKPLSSDDTKPVPEVAHFAEVKDGRLYAIFEKVYFDARMVALDAASGEKAWDVPLVGSFASGSLGDTGRGVARGLLVTRARVYVPRAGGGLDVFDAKDGKPVGTIGKK